MLTLLLVINNNKTINSDNNTKINSTYVDNTNNIHISGNISISSGPGGGAAPSSAPPAPPSRRAGRPRGTLLLIMLTCVCYAVVYVFVVVL